MLWCSTNITDFVVKKGRRIYPQQLLNPQNNYFMQMVVLPRTLNEDYKPVTNKADYKPIPALKKRLSQISTAHILFSIRPAFDRYWPPHTVISKRTWQACRWTYIEK